MSSATEAKADALIKRGGIVESAFQARTFYSESATDPGRRHTVTLGFDPVLSRYVWTCTCEAGKFHGDCYHVIAAKKVIVTEGLVTE